MSSAVEDKNIKDAIEYFVKEEKIKKKGNVQLSLALKTIDDVSRSKGLSAEDIVSLIGVAASGCHGNDISCKLIKCLIPASVFPVRAVELAISYMCTSIPSNKVQAMLLRLLIAVFDYIEKKNVFQKIGYLLFYFIENTILTPYVCHLLSLLTRREDVRLFRVRRLLDLQTKLGSQPYIIGLLSTYKLYFPNLVSIVIPSTRKQFFPTRDRQWCSLIREVQDRNQAADTAHMKSSLELSEKLRATESSIMHGVPPAKRRKVDPIPVIHCSSSKLTVKLSSRLAAMLEERPIPFVQIPDIGTLLRNPVNVELPSQIGAALRSPLFQCFMSYSADLPMTCRFSYWLQDTLCQELLDSTITPGCFPRIESILEKLIEFSEFIQNNLLGVEMLFEIQKPRLMPRLFYFKQHFSTSEVILQQPQEQEGIPVVDQVLFLYLHVWNGLDFRPQVFRLVTRCRLYPFSVLNENILEPLRKLFVRTSVFIKCQVIMSLTQLLRNYATVEMPRYHQNSPKAKPRVCVFEDTAEVLDPLSTVRELIHFLDRLCTLGLTLENNHSLLLHFTLNFTEWVSESYARYGLPFVYLPSRHITKAFLSDNALGPARLCGVTQSYKRNCQLLREDISSNKIESSHFNQKDTVHSLNILILDLCDTLWRKKAFTHGRIDSYFHFEPGHVDIEANDGLSLYLHQAFLPFSVLFLKETQPQENIGHPRGIKEYRVLFAEFLQREHIDEIRNFILNTFMRYRKSISD